MPRLFSNSKLISATIDPASVTNATAVQQTFTLTGKGLTPDMVITSIWMPSLEAGITLSNAFVSAKDTLSVRFTNNTAGAINPASQTVKFLLG